MKLIILSKNINEAIKPLDQEMLRSSLEYIEALFAALAPSAEQPDEVEFIPTSNPWLEWLKESYDNVTWMVELAKQMQIKLYRYELDRGMLPQQSKRSHKSYSPFYSILNMLEAIEESVHLNKVKAGLTPFPQDLPDEYKQVDPIEAYRKYFIDLMDAKKDGNIKLNDLDWYFSIKTENKTIHAGRVYNMLDIVRKYAPSDLDTIIKV